MTEGYSLYNRDKCDERYGMFLLAVGSALFATLRGLDVDRGWDGGVGKRLAEDGRDAGRVIGGGR